MAFLLLEIEAKAEERNSQKGLQILRATRYHSTLQKQNLVGNIIKNEEKTPLSLSLNGKDLRFFYGNRASKKGFVVRLETDKIGLFELNKAGGLKRFPDAKLQEKIYKSDITFEDLALRFLYWNKVDFLDEEKLGGQMCYKLRVYAPVKDKGAYKIVYVWVHKKYGALMKVIACSALNKPIKQFQITKFMPISKSIREMRVDSVNLKDGRITGITYIKFSKIRKRVK